MPWEASPSCNCCRSSELYSSRDVLLLDFENSDDDS